MTNNFTSNFIQMELNVDADVEEGIMVLLCNLWNNIATIQWDLEYSKVIGYEFLDKLCRRKEDDQIRRRFKQYWDAITTLEEDYIYNNYTILRADEEYYTNELRKNALFNSIIYDEKCKLPHDIIINIFEYVKI